MHISARADRMLIGTCYSVLWLCCGSCSRRRQARRAADTRADGWPVRAGKSPRHMTDHSLPPTTATSATSPPPPTEPTHTSINQHTHTLPFQHPSGWMAGACRCRPQPAPVRRVRGVLSARAEAAPMMSLFSIADWRTLKSLQLIAPCGHPQTSCWADRWCRWSSPHPGLPRPRGRWPRTGTTRRHAASEHHGGRTR